MVQKRIMIEGKKYASIKEVAKAYNLDTDLLYRRVESGMTLEEALSLGNGTYSVVVYGITYRNLNALQDALGVDPTLIAARLYRGQTLEEAVTDMLTNCPIEFKGVQYQNMTKLCNYLGVELYLVSKRLRRGWTLDASLLTPPKDIGSTFEYSYRGKTYATQRELVRAYGFTVDLVRRTHKARSIDFVQALDLLVTFLQHYGGERPEVVGGIPTVIYNGVWVNSIKELCTLTGVSLRDLTNYMKKTNTKTHLEALTNMRTAKQLFWVDVATGARTTKIALVEKYGRAIRTIEEHGLARRELLRAYPTCSFNPTGYCATPDKDFNAYTPENYTRPQN